MAIGASPLRKDVTPWCTATSDEEHAVSTVMLGPCQSKKYEIRFDMTARLVPVAV
jgi:iron only hydrogenase large subunit-like protein